MRIALMTNNYKPVMGGVPISIERLKKGLESLGHEVTVFAPSYSGQDMEENVFRYATWLENIFGGIVLPNTQDPAIEKEFRNKPYDVIHVHHPILIGQTAVYLSRKYKIPLVFTYHTRYEQYFHYVSVVQKIKKEAMLCNKAGNPTLRAKLSQKLLYVMQDKMTPGYIRHFVKQCDFIFAPTMSMQNYLQETCNISESKIAILPTGLPEEAYHAKEEDILHIREAYQAMDIPLLVSVSRMSHEKNVSFLLEAIAKVKQQYAKPFRVLMIGDGPQRKEYEDLCQNKGIEDIVVFTGKVPNEKITPFYGAADAFVFASKTETQGIVIIEAMAGATPVYALEATGVSDVVAEGINGRLCQENQDDFANMLLHFLNGQEKNEEMSRQAYHTALAFREEAVAARAVHLYNKVIASKEEKAHNEKHVSWRNAFQ